MRKIPKSLTLKQQLDKYKRYWRDACEERDRLRARVAELEGIERAARVILNEHERQSLIGPVAGREMHQMLSEIAAKILHGLGPQREAGGAMSEFDMKRIKNTAPGEPPFETEEDIDLECNSDECASYRDALECERDRLRARVAGLEGVERAIEAWGEHACTTEMDRHYLLSDVLGEIRRGFGPRNRKA